MRNQSAKEVRIFCDKESGIDDMNDVLLNGDSFFWKDFEVKLIQQKNYEVYKEGVKVKRLPVNWSTYFIIEDMLMNG